MQHLFWGPGICWVWGPKITQLIVRHPFLGAWGLVAQYCPASEVELWEEKVPSLQAPAVSPLPGGGVHWVYGEPQGQCWWPRDRWMHIGGAPVSELVLTT